MAKFVGVGVSGRSRLGGGEVVKITLILGKQGWRWRMNSVGGFGGFRKVKRVNARFI